MFVRNLLQAGDFVTIVPAGIRITLQYSEQGSLECVYVGHQNDQVLHPELLTPILQSNEVPVHLPITKGTSYVYGCLYTGEVYKVEGNLHSTVESNYVSKYLEDPSKFHFFASHIMSYAVGMNTPATVQRWLKAMNFNLLPSYVIPQNITEENFEKIVHTDNYPFAYPRIQEYVLFRKGRTEFVFTNIRQMVVKDIRKYTSYDGYILADITSYDLGSINTTYADVVNFQIQVGSVILVNDDNQIIDCTNVDPKKRPVSTRICCEYCGKVIDVPKKSIRFTCNDSHCVSVMIPKINSMLAKLGLDSLDVEEFKNIADKQGNVVSMTDVFSLKAYENSKITVELPKLLSAVVPSSIVPRFSDWIVLCNKCSNSLQSVIYYLENPDRMMFDLNLDRSIYSKLSTWLKDEENKEDAIGMLNHPNINVVSTGKKFEGAPIFRGKSIYLTGAFQHGSFEEVRAILASYSAEVYDRFNSAVDCIIIGGLHEGVSGKAIQRAKQMNIPIFEESEFFSKYDIDSDIQLNLS